MSEILSMLQEKYSFITKIEVYQIKIKYLCYCLIQQIMYHLDFETDLHIEIKKVEERYCYQTRTLYKIKIKVPMPKGELEYHHRIIH